MDKPSFKKRRIVYAPINAEKVIGDISVSDERISSIKANVTIFDVAKLMDIELVGSGKSFHSPFREDNKPSFSVFEDGKAFKDFGTDEKGDVIGFYRLASDADFITAITDLEFIASLKAGGEFEHFVKKSSGAAPSDKGGVLEIPELKYEEKQARMLSLKRKFSMPALREAYNRGIFGFCDYKNQSAWIVKDLSGVCAQARRLDGMPWGSGNQTHKAETLKYSDCSCPIGVSSIGERKFIVFCEGSTDLLAAFHFGIENGCAELIAPVAMMGANAQIGEKFLEAFKGKHILIVPHIDEAGANALANWGNALSEVAASVLYLDLESFKKADGSPIKDLCDFIDVDISLFGEELEFANPFLDLLKEGK